MSIYIINYLISMPYYFIVLPTQASCVGANLILKTKS